MKPLTNLTILIIFKDQTRGCFSVRTQEDPVKAYKKILSTQKYIKEDIEKWYSFPRSLYTPDQYEKYWNHTTDKLDEKQLSIDAKVEEFKKQRSSFMPLLDLEFMKSLEENDDEHKKHIVLIKNFLREGPDALEKHLSTMDNIADIVTLNAFNNIFEVFLSKKGSGYSSPPVITIDPPDGKYPGIPMKAVATLDGDGIGEVFVTQIGSGYIYPPRVKASPPAAADGEESILFASSLENDIIENMSHLETRIFQD